MSLVYLFKFCIFFTAFSLHNFIAQIYVYIKFCCGDLGWFLLNLKNSKQKTDIKFKPQKRLKFT